MSLVYWPIIVYNCPKWIKSIIISLLLKHWNYLYTNFSTNINAKIIYEDYSFTPYCLLKNTVLYKTKRSKDGKIILLYDDDNNNKKKMVFNFNCGGMQITYE